MKRVAPDRADRPFRETPPRKGDQPLVILHAGGLPPPYRDVRETIHPVGWDMDELHWHDFWQLVFNCGGEAEVATDRPVRVPAGRLAVLPPGFSHTWRNASGTPLDLVNIHIFPHQSGFEELEKYLQALCAGPSRMGLLSMAPQFPRLMRSITDEYREGRYGYRFEIAALLTRIVTTILRTGLKDAPRRDAFTGTLSRIEKALWYIEANSAKPLHLRDIGRILNVSPKHACELFRRQAGISPMAHLRNVRVQKAGLLLEDTSLGIKEIAFEAGFRDEHYFSRSFRRVTGISPTAFRARCRP